MRIAASLMLCSIRHLARSIAPSLILFAVLIPVGESSYAATIVDTLNGMSTGFRFDIPGSSGISVASDQSTGPRFTLFQSTVIEEIGGFLTTCGFNLGVPQCSPPGSASIQIRPSLNGVPDLSTVLANYPLTLHQDQLLISYESVRPNIRLDPGNYFAMFTAGQGFDGYLLGNSFSTGYTAGTPTLGVIDPRTNRSFLDEVPAAVRILGSVIPEPTTLYLFLAGLCALAIRRAMPRLRKNWSSPD